MLQHLKETNITNFNNAKIIKKFNDLKSSSSSNDNSMIGKYNNNVDDNGDININNNDNSNTSYNKNIENIKYIEKNEEPPELEEEIKKLVFLPELSQLLFPPSPDDFYEVKNAFNKKNGDQDNNKNNNKHDIDIHNNDDNNNNISQKNDEFNKIKKEKEVYPIIKNKTWPILQVKNVYILPGVPQFFSLKMNLLTKYFLKNYINTDFLLEKRKIILTIEETKIIKILNKIVDKYNKFVKIGSYPFVDNTEFKTIITMESIGENKNYVDEATKNFLTELPENVVLRVEKETVGENICKIE
jgi:hypothetical protein